MSKHPPARGQWEPNVPNIPGAIGDPHIQWQTEQPNGLAKLRDKEPILALAGVLLALLVGAAYFFNF